MAVITIAMNVYAVARATVRIAALIRPSNRDAKIVICHELPSVIDIDRFRVSQVQFINADFTLHILTILFYPSCSAGIVMR